jgi:tryptophanyl-tRNA synthetase
MAQPINKRPRVLSGMRPTGKLHLGNLVGALQNWIKLQDKYDSFHFVADWHMLTTEYENTSELQTNILEMVTDWLAVGLDPKKATFFVQSRLLEHAELFLILSMLTPLGWLERVPTYKEQLENIKDRDIHTFGFLGYPVLQAADILMYKADYVPVGEDQVPHVELTREIARRFNTAYGELILQDRPDEEWSRLGTAVGLPHEINLQLFPDSPKAAKDKKGLIARHYRSASLAEKAYYRKNGLGEPKDIFPEPQSLLTHSPRLRGTDGRKMSKSYDNAIFLSDPPAVVDKKVRGMMTDPARMRRHDPGDPEKCPVFDHHKIFSPPEVIERADRECRTAEIGCVECKKLMAQRLNEYLAPIQERRTVYERDPKKVRDVLEAGTEKARRVAQETMGEVRAATKLA